MKKYLFLSFIPMILACNHQGEKELTYTSPLDYETYLSDSTDSMMENLKEECRFWESRLEQQPLGFTYLQKLGTAQLGLFDKTGDVEYLHQAESAFEQVSGMVGGRRKTAGMLTLSSLKIKKHEFREAGNYAMKAMNLTDQKFGPLMMQFDAEMEMGNYELAGNILKRNRRMDSFDYLVRLSKYKDYEGDLDSAIFYMENARQLVRRENSQRAIWVNANLGDMYGHANRISDSYNQYLKVLEMDPTYDYALKGIAWIAWSADKNAEEASRIVKRIKERTAMPDLYLLLAEMAEGSGRLSEASAYISSFLQEAQKEHYGAMYNKYLISIHSSQQNFEEAIRLAKQEIEARPTPAAYDWLAWTFFQKGAREEALEIYKQYVEGKSFEPELIYHMGVVYHELGIPQSHKYLEEALEASFELGPVVAKDLKKYLKS